MSAPMEPNDRRTPAQRDEARRRWSLGLPSAQQEADFARIRDEVNAERAATGKRPLDRDRTRP